LGQSPAHLEGVGGVVESYYDKVAHVCFLWSVGFVVLFQTVYRFPRLRINIFEPELGAVGDARCQAAKKCGSSPARSWQ
jgi:hypothetical protein